MTLAQLTHFYTLTWEWGLTPGRPTVSDVLEVHGYLTCLRMEGRL